MQISGFQNSLLEKYFLFWAMIFSLATCKIKIFYCLFPCFLLLALFSIEDSRGFENRELFMRLKPQLLICYLQRPVI